MFGHESSKGFRVFGGNLVAEGGDFILKWEPGRPWVLGSPGLCLAGGTWFVSDLDPEHFVGAACSLSLKDSSG